MSHAISHSSGLPSTKSNSLPFLGSMSWSLSKALLPCLRLVSPHQQESPYLLHFAGTHFFPALPLQGVASGQVRSGIMVRVQCPAGRVFQYRVGSGRVLDKIPGIGSGSGRVGVSKYTIGYFRVSFLLSGIFGYFGYFRVCRVFSGISCFTHIY